jgi:hypothetical protein
MIFISSRRYSISHVPSAPATLVKGQNMLVCTPVPRTTHFLKGQLHHLHMYIQCGVNWKPSIHCKHYFEHFDCSLFVFALLTTTSILTTTLLMVTTLIKHLTLVSFVKFSITSTNQINLPNCQLWDKSISIDLHIQLLPFFLNTPIELLLSNWSTNIGPVKCHSTRCVLYAKTYRNPLLSLSIFHLFTQTDRSRSVSKAHSDACVCCFKNLLFLWCQLGHQYSTGFALQTKQVEREQSCRMCVFFSISAFAIEIIINPSINAN